MPPIRVDVVIPTRNRCAIVPSAIRDALGQEGVEARCIVVDDGSEDATADVVRALADERVALLRHEGHEGPSAARNTGVRAATAPWVAFLDDDDRWAPTKLAAQLAAVEGEPGARWATTGCVTTDADLRVTGAQAFFGGGGEAYDRLLVDCFVPAGGSSIVAERTLLEEAGEFDVGLGAIEDWDMWIRLARLSPIAYVHRPLVAYRRWGGNSSADTARMQANREALLARYASAREGDAASATQDLRFAQWLARCALQEGRHAEAARRYVGIAWTSRSPSQTAYALAALCAPGLAVRRLAVLDRQGEPIGWREEAAAWLGS